MAFGGPRSWHQDSRNDWTPCRMARPFVSAGAHAPHSDEMPDLTATRGSSHSARRLRSLAFLGSSYVDQAHAQENFSTVTSVGLDETASRRGRNAQRVLYACEGRKARVVAQFADALEAHGACAGNSCAVCMDMSASYQAGVCEHCPGPQSPSMSFTSFRGCLETNILIIK